MVINNKICKVEGCIKQPSLKTKSLLCGMHHHRWRIYKSYDLPEKPLIPDGYIKICKIHGYLTKEQTRFRKNRGNHYLACKICSSKQANKISTDESLEKRRGLYILNRADILRKSRQQKLNKYNLTESEYNDLVVLQNNLCAICKKPESAIDKRTKKIRNLAIDHCHKSHEKGIMKVRGLLCGKCNTAFGLLNDSVEILQSALDYAIKYS